MGRVAASTPAGPPTTRVIRLSLAYDGTGFRGWARQRDPSIRTVQGELEQHLERVLLERPTLKVAGRTDAGVHARGQVASFASGTRVARDRLRSALNAALAPEVVVRERDVRPSGVRCPLLGDGARVRVPDRLGGGPGPVLGSVRLAPARAAVRPADAGGCPGPGRGARLHLVLPASRAGSVDGASCGTGDRRSRRRAPRRPPPRERVPPSDGPLDRRHARRCGGGAAGDHPTWHASSGLGTGRGRPSWRLPADSPSST